MKQLRFFLTLGICMLVFFYGSTTLIYSKQALTLWFETLIPSMFVSLVCVRYIYDQNILVTLHIPFLEKLLCIDQHTLVLVLCILLLGFPNGAILIDEAYQQHRLSLKQARRLLYTCSIASPGFVIMSCGIGIYHSSMIGICLFLTQLATIFIFLFITRFTPISMPPLSTTNKGLKTAMIESGISLFMLGGYLMLTTSIIAIFCQWFPPSQANLIQMLSEFSSGIYRSFQLPYSLSIKKLLTCQLLGFGGFCVHLQTRSLCSFSYSYPCYITFRIIQAILSSILFAFLL